MANLMLCKVPHNITAIAMVSHTMNIKNCNPTVKNQGLTSNSGNNPEDPIYIEFEPDAISVIRPPLTIIRVYKSVFKEIN